MGFFDKISKAVDLISKAGEQIEKVVDSQNGNKSASTSVSQNATANKSTSVAKELIFAPTSHIVETTEFGNDDDEYTVTFMVNDSFREADCGAAEVLMLNTYGPGKEYGDPVAKPYVAILCDDSVYTPVEQYKKSGTFKGAIDLTPLSGKFFFKAKREFAGDMMYFYGLDRCDGFWNNNGICIVYSKAYVGTETETKLMAVLDEVAETYKEVKVN